MLNETASQGPHWGEPDSPNPLIYKAASRFLDEPTSRGTDRSRGVRFQDSEIS